MVSKLVQHRDKSIVWCQLNKEGDLLDELIPGAVQVSGDDSEERKESVLVDFAARKSEMSYNEASDWLLGP